MLFNRFRRRGLIAIALGATATTIGLGGASTATASGAAPTFGNPSQIDNPYAPLTKFDQCVLKGKEGGAKVRAVRTPLDRTEPFTINGQTVQAAVIEDRDFEDGELVERTLDYFAQSDEGTVYYLGEDVDDYENGQIVGHGGAWRFGRDTNTLGVIMPNDPQVGDTFQPESVPGITSEKDRVVERLGRVEVHGKTYKHVIRVREVQNPGHDIEFKLYAKGKGVIVEDPADGKLTLRSCS